MKKLAVVIAFLIVVAGTGCANAPPNQKVPTKVPSGQKLPLKIGALREDVREHFSGNGTHQFTAKVEADTYTCTSYSFSKSFIKYYFVFKNDRLISILNPGQFFVWETKPHPTLPSSVVEVQKPWNDEKRMQNIIAVDTMSPQAFAQELDKKIEKDRKKKKSYNVLPAYVILAPLLVPQAIARNMREKGWLRQYDPFKIKLGAKRSEIESVYGRSHFVRKHSGANRETHAYGPMADLFRDAKQLNLGLNKKFWTAVVYEGDVAVRIFGNDLFNGKEIVTFENEVK